MKAALLSNINIDFLIQEINKKNGEVYTPAGFGTWLTELADAEAVIYKSGIQAVFVILDGEEYLSHCDDYDSGVREMEQALSIINQAALSHPQMVFVISDLDITNRRIKPSGRPTLERLWEAYWYNGICRLAYSLPNFHIFDLKAVIEKMGRNSAYSQKLWYCGSMRFSVKCCQEIAEQVFWYVKTIRGIRKKCLILDLDNTLWGGVVGEEGFLNITLSKSKEGARFYDLQRRIKELKSTGIVLAVVSKNNEHDAKEPFEKHPYMLLKLSDFVAFKANWKPKSENIRELARELNIGLDSFVLLDDNPVEQEEVKASIPEVEVLEFPRDTTLLQETINRAFKEHFHTLGLTKEDTDKTLMYLQERERKESIKKFISADDYLNSLDMKVKVHLINESDIERVAQLTQKTNQFNLTTRRYTAEEIRDLCYSGSSIIYVISVSDRFGDSGTVSVLIFNRKDDTAHIDTFLMSCRVMGRYIEDDTFPAVLKHLLGLGVRYITAEYIPSSRNEPVKTLFERLGFDLVSESEDGRKEYRLSMENSLKSGPGYSQVILI